MQANKSLPVFLTAHWQNLVMANFACDPALLKPYLPYRTELDFYKGTCHVSLVGFLFADTRVKGIAIPGHTEFEEVNLRFYVRYHDGSEWKRGAVFIQEIVPRRAISWVANTLYKEHYVYHPMRHEWTDQADGKRVRYEWQVDGQWNFMQVSCAAEPHLPHPDNEEAFISEHYWGYTRLGPERTAEYQVEHPQWEVYRVKNYQHDINARRMYGEAFHPVLAAEPTSVFMAKGSAVQVRKGAVIG